MAVAIENVATESESQMMERKKIDEGSNSSCP
jgi:hypothetical protein